MRQVKLLITLSKNAQVDLSFRWVHMSEGTFSDVLAHSFMPLSMCSIGMLTKVTRVGFGQILNP